MFVKSQEFVRETEKDNGHQKPKKHGDCRLKRVTVYELNKKTTSFYVFLVSNRTRPKVLLMFVLMQASGLQKKLASVLWRVIRSQEWGATLEGWIFFSTSYSWTPKP